VLDCGCVHALAVESHPCLEPDKAVFAVQFVAAGNNHILSNAHDLLVEVAAKNQFGRSIDAAIHALINPVAASVNLVGMSGGVGRVPKRESG